MVRVSSYYLPNPPAGFKRGRIFTDQVGTVRDEVFDVYELEAN